MYVCLGCILGGLGIYQTLEEFGGAGATVPLTGFGFRLAEGVMKEVDSAGFLGIFTGGMKAAAGGVTAAYSMLSLPRSWRIRKKNNMKKAAGRWVRENVFSRLVFCTAACKSGLALKKFFPPDCFFCANFL